MSNREPQVNELDTYCRTLKRLTATFHHLVRAKAPAASIHRTADTIHRIACLAALAAQTAEGGGS